MPIVPFHPYSRDSRGAKLLKYKIKKRESSPHAEGLMICASPEIEAQIVALSGDSCIKGNLNEAASRKYTAGYVYEYGVPPHVRSLLPILENHLTLNHRYGVNIAMSLDWHKQPDEDGELVPTEAGRWIQWTKWAKYPEGSGSVRAWNEMVAAMAKFIESHPVYAHAGLVTAPPGHAADGNSWGERLARAVADKVGIPYVQMHGAGPRAELKSEEAATVDLTGQFALAQPISGRVLIIDDVYHSGSTMDAASQVCREAGAEEILVLTVTRAIRR